MNEQALTGVKVLDFGWAIAGAETTRHLANYGAQVVRVESITHPDAMRTSRRKHGTSSASGPDSSPLFPYFNTSKYSMTLDLKNPQSREVMDRLIRWADVVNENFTPNTLNKMGLAYDYMRTIKPDIIMVGCSIYGQTGPRSHEGGNDSTGNAASGRLDLRGWPDRGPLLAGGMPYGDVVLPCFLALAIVAALDYRRRTGKGQYIDGSQAEMCVQQISPAFLDLQANGHLQTLNGNRITYAAPYGLFPCKGVDRWCAVSVFTDLEWESFCDVIGNPSWVSEKKFTSLESRKQHEDELEKLVAAWTEKYTAEEVMHMMQEAGVPAGVVQNGEDMENDPQLKEWGAYISLEHPVLGTFDHPTTGYKLMKTEAQIKTSPCLGEHTYYVCSELLGMSIDQFIALDQQGVFK